MSRSAASPSSCKYCSYCLYSVRLTELTASSPGPLLASEPARLSWSLGTRLPNSYEVASAFSYPEPFLRAVNGARRGALAKSITGYHKNMVRKQYPVLELANQMPVRIWIWPERLVAPRVRRALGTRMVASAAATKI